MRFKQNIVSRQSRLMLFNRLDIEIHGQVVHWSTYSNYQFKIKIVILKYVVYKLLGLVGNNEPAITGPAWEADSSLQYGNALELIAFISRDLTFKSTSTKKKDFLGHKIPKLKHKLNYSYPCINVKWSIKMTTFIYNGDSLQKLHGNKSITSLMKNTA